MSENTYPSKKSGIPHLFAAVKYSSGGAARLIKETAARHELAAYVGVLILFAIIGAAPLHYMISTILFLVLLATEALNTAVEEIVDHISRDYSIPARHAKDLGSFAVLCLLAANVTLVGYVIFDALWIS
jgi:diacylglycerol kinase (ATP)